MEDTLCNCRRRNQRCQRCGSCRDETERREVRL